MTTEIVRRIEDVAKLLSEVNADKKKAARLIKDANRLIKDLQVIKRYGADRAAGKDVSSLRQKNIRAMLKASPAAEAGTTAAVEKRADATDDGDEADAMGLARFFDEVAKSLVTAQQNLNQQSLEYVRELGPAIPPTFFAIPSLKAEMKVGFRNVDSKGINLILFSKKRQRDEYGESTVTLEVAAAPPPPGEITPGELIVQPPGFLVIGGERTRLLAAVRELAKADAGSDLGKRYDNTESLALVVRRAPVGPGQGRYLVVWPARAKNVEALAEVSVFGLVDRDGQVELDRGLFERLSFLTISNVGDLLALNKNRSALVKLMEERPADAEHRAALEGKTPKELAELAIRLAALARDVGHALDLAVLAVEGWQATVRRPPLPAAAGS